MIPKIIHYCWLSGDPYPKLVQDCMKTWKEQLPEYEFVLWDTNKIDVNSNIWLKQAYKKKKYAFAADYIRFYALYNFGGIYLDADVEVLKPFDDLLNRDYFIGKEAYGDIEAAVMGSEKGSAWTKAGLDYYLNRSFQKDDGTLDTLALPVIMDGIAETNHLIAFPYQYFSPKNYFMYSIDKSEETYCIHHFDGKWEKKSLKNTLKINAHRILILFCGRERHNKILKWIRKLRLQK